jgi:hypothetical protein
MELKYKLVEEIMSELNMRNSENVLKCFERLLEEMSSNKLKGILEDLQEERLIGGNLTDENLELLESISK